MIFPVFSVRFSDGGGDHRLQEGGHQPGQCGHTHCGQPWRPHHSVFASWSQQLLLPLQRSEVAYYVKLDWKSSI